MKVIVTAIKEREEYVKEIQDQIPNLNVVWDIDRNAMNTFLRGWTSFGEESRLILQDDIILTDNFLEKATKVINEYPNTIITFFSMKGADQTEGTRYMQPSTYCMNQCYYLPQGYGKSIAKFYKTWARKAEHPTADDYLIADFMKHYNLKYVISVPSLVQHREVKSVINPRRSTKRQSKTFEE